MNKQVQWTGTQHKWVKCNAWQQYETPSCAPGCEGSFPWAIIHCALSRCPKGLGWDAAETHARRLRCLARSLLNFHESAFCPLLSRCCGIQGMPVVRSSGKIGLAAIGMWDQVVGTHAEGADEVEDLQGARDVVCGGHVGGSAPIDCRDTPSLREWVGCV